MPLHKLMLDYTVTGRIASCGDSGEPMHNMRGEYVYLHGKEKTRHGLGVFGTWIVGSSS